MINEIIEKLGKLGFTDSTPLNEFKGVVTVRIMTKHGWTYEKFPDPASVDVWASKHPELINGNAG